MPRRKQTLRRKDILRAFAALSDELTRRRVRADMFVTGGAAMVVAYQTRRMTRDVDAIFEPKAVVYEAAAVVGEQLCLPENWLNDAMKSYLPGTDSEARTVFSSPALAVSAASPRYLLAMKLLAARVEQDTDDIVALYRVLGFTIAAEGMALLEEYYPGHVFEPRTQFLLEELFGPARRGTRLVPGGRSDVPRAKDFPLLAPGASGPLKAMQCQGRRRDGGRCERMVGPGQRCPWHGWQPPAR